MRTARLGNQAGSHRRNLVRARFGIVLLCIAMLLVLVPSCLPRRGRQPWHPNQPIRAIWVTRWDYKTPRDIDVIMENVRRAGFNTVLFQVRGHGTAFYRSRLEPWADELGGRDPGFDPLAVACHEAHVRNLSLHAWVNVMPGWRGKKPPANRRQLYNAHPGWFWHDAQGRRQPMGWYVSLNPCYPEVRRYLTDVMQEIVSGYPVDGLHLDYIRFPNEWNNSYPRGAVVPDYPRDPRTLQLFRQETGQAPESNPAAWVAWRASKVTELVADIRHMMQRRSPRAVLSAAVGADPARARNKHFQDASVWIRHGLVDAVFPMNYVASVPGYEQNLANWMPLRKQVAVVPGIMFDKRDPNLVNGQIQASRRLSPHFAAFAYNSLFPRLDENGRPQVDSQDASRRALQAYVLPHIRQMAGLVATR